MADIASAVIGAVACVAQYLSPPGEHRINRWREFKRNYKLLKTKVNRLKAERTSLQRRVNLAKNNGDGIEENVQNWLESAEEIEVEIQKWLKRASKITGDDQEARKIRKDEETAAAGETGGDAEKTAEREIREGKETVAAAGTSMEIGEDEEAVAAAAGEIRADEEKTASKMRCFKGLCPNLKARYQLSKEAGSLLEDVAKHLEGGNFDRISYPVIPKDPRLSNKGYEAFESRAFNLKKVISSLSDPAVNMVGIYGMGGIGKTTLAKEVATQTISNKVFDSVIFVEITEKPDIIKIQRHIAEKLDLTLSHEEIETTVTAKVYQQLKEARKILVVLDNMWKYLDLETVGIPYGDDHKGCKILLTARDRSVLSSMGSNNNSSIGVLNEEEAWRLFKKMSGDDVENRKLKSTAVAVAKACGGLPIAITTIARALRNKSVAQWKKALRELQTPTSENFEGVSAEAYSTIELSYKYLKGEELKKIFLLCSLMSYSGLTSDLFKYGMGLGIFRGVNTLEDAWNELYALVDELKDSCLLLEGDSSTTFFMHDVVRAVAISIACREQHAFAVRNKVAWKWPNKDTLEKCTAISIIDSSIPELPEGLECPELEFFFVRINNSSVKIPENFFTAMRKLRAVDLTGMRLMSLPSSLDVLTNLQTLCLDQGVFKDVAIIGKLKNLEILSFIKSDIVHLPKELSQLTKLRLLDLSRCYKLEVIAPHVISSLTQLEELYMSGCSVKWGVEGPNGEKSSARLDELMHLPHLSALEIDITNENTLPEGLLSRKLSKYRISLGNAWCEIEEHETSRMLKLGLNSRNICLENLQVVKDVEYLWLNKLQGVENLLFKLDTNGLAQLKYLHVQNNPEFLCIVDSMERILCDPFPLLKWLSLDYLINLEKICCDELGAESFNELNTVKIRYCNKLRNSFSFSTSKCLPQLQKIVVEYCHNMEEIFAIGGENDAINNQVLDKIEFAQLTTLKLRYLPQLSCFCKVVKTQESLITSTSTQLFSEKVVLPNFEDLELREINVEKIWHNELPITSSSSFQSLTRLIVSGCHKLRYIFPSSMAKCFVQLQQLEIFDCMALEEIIAREEGAEVATSFVFPRVTTLKLYELPKLRCFYPGMHTSEWPVLEKLTAYSCDKIKLFASELISFNQGTQPLFFVEKAFLNLEELGVNGKDFAMICQNEFLEQLLGKLRFLAVMNDESPDFPLVLLERFQNLEELILVGSSYKGIFSNGQVEIHVGKLVKIKHLKLSELDELNHLWEQNSKTDSIFQSLDVLEVQSCQNLTNLLPSSVSFGHLTLLDVFNCKKLMNLMTSTTAKSLVQLVNMRVGGCSGMTDVVVVEVASEGDVTRDNIIFSKLKSLSLFYLDSLTSFCSGNCTLKFSCLEYLQVYSCPKMKIFSGGELITPRVYVSYDDRAESLGDDGDLNTTIQEFHQQKLLHERSIDSIVI